MLRILVSALLAFTFLASSPGIACWQFEAAQEMEIRETYFIADDTPRWSDDGAVIVFSTRSRIYRISTHGDDLQPIPKKRHDGQFSPSLSPQGRIAYLNYNKRHPLLVHAITNHYLETMNFDGKGIKRLAKLEYATRPLWSPDGSQLAYSQGGNTATIKVTAPDGSVQTELGPNPLVRIGHMKWHSNGRRIAVWNDPWAITTVDLETNTWHVAADFRGLGGYVSPPAWSRSDERLYYISRAPGIDENEQPTMPFVLHSANYDGSDRRVIAD